VAFFQGRRPRGFDALIGWFQDSVGNRCDEWLKRDWLRLAPVGQIHATLIGMEAQFAGGDLINNNWRAATIGVQAEPMDLDGFAAYLHQMESPIRLRFGGFSREAVNPFDARMPFERSFTVRPDGLIVAVGWPWAGGVIRPALVDFRKGAEKFNIIHKYHMNRIDHDNDAFLVLGAVTPMPWDDQAKLRSGHEGFIAALSEVQGEIRELLQAAPLEVELLREHCCVVRYRSMDLAGVSERDVLPFSAVTAGRLRELYL
jgi:hypothetical protein